MSLKQAASLKAFQSFHICLGRQFPESPVCNSTPCRPKDRQFRLFQPPKSTHWGTSKKARWASHAGDRMDFQSGRSLHLFPLLHFSFCLATWQTGVKGKITAGENKPGYWWDPEAGATFIACSLQPWHKISTCTMHQNSTFTSKKASLQWHPWVTELVQTILIFREQCAAQTGKTLWPLLSRAQTGVPSTSLSRKLQMEEAEWWEDLLGYTGNLPGLPQSWVRHVGVPRQQG